jgi:phosphocarrier protein
MQNFEYKISDEIGLHARPAGLLAKFAKQFHSDIKMEYNGKSASAKALMGIMGLEALRGAVVSVTVEGDDELEAAKKLKEFMSENL